MARGILGGWVLVTFTMGTARLVALLGWGWAERLTPGWGQPLGKEESTQVDKAGGHSVWLPLPARLLLLS